MRLDKFFCYFIFLLIKIDILNAQSCNVHSFKFIENKVFCEADNDVSTSCLGKPFPVKRAYVRCSNKYHNYKNIPLLTIDCQDNGEWSDKIFRCRPECDDSNISFNLINHPDTEYPPWYAEVIEFYPNSTIKNFYPGVILAERQILTKREYFDPSLPEFSAVNLEIRIPRLKYKKPKKYVPIFKTYFNNKDLFVTIPGLTTEEIANTTTVIYIDQKEYIQFDDVTLPACDRIYSEEDKGTLKLLQFGKRWISDLLPIYEVHCYVPQVNKTEMEVACFRFNNEQSECGVVAYRALVRCQIGYQQNTNNNKDFITTCTLLDNWVPKLEENDGCTLVCGEVDRKYRPRQTELIFGGSETHNGFAPWHVAIYLNNTKKQTIQQICGGNIIHSNIILSAAHCFYNRGTDKINNASSYIIGAGKFYRRYETLEESEQYSSVYAIHIPENFESFPIRNDIAVLILDKHMNYTANIKPVCIDFSSHTIPGDLEGSIVGWGARSATDEESNELLTTNLTTLTNIRCKQVVGPTDKSEVTNEKFCAINENGSAACRGDSGGGYVIKKSIDGKDRYFLLGVVSIGLNSKNFCSNGFTTVFTNILIYEDFIKKSIAIGRNRNTYERYENLKERSKNSNTSTVL
ncbi:mannan-binding lectin serine protease 1-like [Condylostylus longicornis]|uniref:mannan-binding lectin serine protease 1-like n=1 Tax=Condylostylus longicornis TaxID=2530218 RepID=UPI00244DA800|nr:mannan-binding lectin serine protease 1-like [Condylostylus longicornis]